MCFSDVCETVSVVLMTCFQMSERVKLQPPFFQFRSRLKAAELDCAHKRLQLTECVCDQTNTRSLSDDEQLEAGTLSPTDSDITVDTRAWFLHDDVIH